MYTDFRSLCADVANCTKCPLHKTRTNTVFGEGSLNADVMFIGEGPGGEEDRQGRPFVGKAGQLLDRMIAVLGLSREEVYIANIVKCRPPHNRDPQPEEEQSCIGYLRAQVAFIKPRIIVCLGRISARNLLGVTSITQARGKWVEKKGFSIMPTYHPAALLREPAKKKEAYADLLAVRERLNEIKEKTV
jgi:uracil-DNA glycosylase family 4